MVQFLVQTFKDKLIKISIHVSAKGATDNLGISFSYESISIHAPAKGATFATIHWQSGLTYISIHAPAKGATVSEFDLYLSSDISIHAPAKGATINTFLRDEFGSISIHAPAKGATNKEIEDRKEEDNFNPRTREGCDSAWLHRL